MEKEPIRKPSLDSFMVDLLSDLAQKYPKAKATIIGAETGIIVRTHFADGRPVDHKIEYLYETDSLKSTFPTKKHDRVHLNVGEEVEIVLKYYPEVNSWEEIDLDQALEEIRQERREK